METKPAARPSVQRQSCAKRPALQPAAKISSPHDPAEKEAEATARKVMRMTLPDRGASPAPSFESPYVRRLSAGIPRKKSDEREILRKAEAAPAAGNVVSEISAAAPEGSALPQQTRSFMEPRFGADFGSVRIHTGDRAARLSSRLGAAAFTYGDQIFFGRDRFRPETDQGRELIAHELTHTMQQGSVVQRAVDSGIACSAPLMIQCLGIGDALGFIADQANNIPGFRMLTIVLGVNPINMSRVDRSAANILRAMVEFMPMGGLIVRALDNYGIFEQAGGWIEGQVRALGMTGAALKQALDQFLDGLGLRDILNPGGVWDRARRLFTAPVERLIGFARSAASELVRLVKRAILMPLARLAEGTRGYKLLCAVLGENPITGDPVPRNAENLLGGFMTFIGQEEIWNNLKRTNAVPRAWNWFKSAVSELLGFVRQIPGLFIQALAELSVADIIQLPQAFTRVSRIFGSFAAGFISWGGNAVWKLLEIIFEVVAPGVIPYLKRAAGTFRTILRNPLGFVGNLVRAGAMGLRQFAANIARHLRTSLIQWITGALSGAGIYIPQSFELREIIKFVLSVLGLTWQNIRGKLVRAVGETAVRAMETGFEIVATLVTEGPAAAWEKIKEAISNLKEMVIEEIMNFVTTRIVQSAIQKLVSMLNPVVGGIIQVVSGIYNTIMFFIERMRQIIQVATAFIDSITAIAGGALAAAANRVEQTLAGLLTLAISFLARLVGLGRVSDAITNVVNRIRAPIDRALDRVVEWIVRMARRAGRFLVTSARRGAAAAGSAARRLFSWAFARRRFTDEEGKAHSLYVHGEGRSARLMIASTPSGAAEFLEAYLVARGAAFRTENQPLITRLKNAIKDADKLVTDIAPLAQSDPVGAQCTALQRALLEKNVAISDMLSTLIGSNTSLAKVLIKYKLEGMTGTYASIPKMSGDELTPDHQPQAAILQAAAEFDYFKTGKNLAQRAAGRAKEGFAINLHSRRHMAGRTYGSKGKETKEAFLKKIETMIAGEKTVAGKRKKVVARIKADLISDIGAMHSVAASPCTSEVWADIRALVPSPKKDQEKVVEDIRKRIVAGEAQLRAQDIDSLIT